MRHSSSVALAAALIVGGTGAVLAQSGNPSYGPGGPQYGAPQGHWGNQGHPHYGPNQGFNPSNQGSWGGQQAFNQGPWAGRQGGHWGNQRSGWNQGMNQENWNHPSPGARNWQGNQWGGHPRFGQNYGPGPRYGQDQQWGENQQFGQNSQQEDQNQQISRNQEQGGQTGGEAETSGSIGSRFQQRSALRRQLRQVGFQQVRILDAAYLVQASTPDGRTVLMIVDPSSQMSGSGDAQTGQNRNSGNGQMFGSLENQLGRSTMPSHNAGGSSDQRFMSQQSYLNEDDQGRTGQSGTGSIGQNGAGGMNAGQVRSMLQDRGFSNIENLQREGGAFTASADWQGEQVDVTINARTGEITEPASL